MPGDQDYEQARQISNLRVEGSPAVIARCAGVADVRAALSLASEHGLEVSVRGGGHGVAGWSSNDGGLVIDLSRMRWVRIDPTTSTAWIGGGTIGNDLIVEASQFGLAPVTGTNPGIGIAGLVMGVGEGYLTPKYGFGADNVLAFELVTGDGSVLRVSADEHPDLFWAMRGAGPNFGVVTALRLQLYPAPQYCTGGALEFDFEDAPRVTRHVWELMETGSEYISPWLTYSRVPESGQLRVTFWAGHTGPREVAEREIGAVRACASPTSDSIRPMSYLELVHQEQVGVRARQAWDLCRFEFDGPFERQMEVLLEQANQVLLNTGILLWRTVPKETATPPSVIPRLPGISIFCSASWELVADDEKNLRWLQDTTAAFRASGLVTEATNTINHTSTADNNRIESFYGTKSYQRLQQLKAQYDPENRFHRNHNITPP